MNNILQRMLSAINSLSDERLIHADYETTLYADLKDVVSNEGSGGEFTMVLAALREAFGLDNLKCEFSVCGVDDTGKKVKFGIPGIVNKLPLVRASEFAKELFEDQKRGWLHHEGYYVKFNDTCICLNPMGFYAPLLEGKFKDQKEFVYLDRMDDNLRNIRIITEFEKWDYLQERYDVPGEMPGVVNLAAVN